MFVSQLAMQPPSPFRLKKDGTVYGWPSGGYPAPQGPFYCAVGSESVYGRPLAEAHMDACIKVSHSRQGLPHTSRLQVKAESRAKIKLRRILSFHKCAIALT